MNEEIYLDEYICYDGPLPKNPVIDNMSKEEIEEEFIRRFGEYC